MGKRFRVALDQALLNPQLGIREVSYLFYFPPYLLPRYRYFDRHGVRFLFDCVSLGDRICYGGDAV